MEESWEEWLRDLEMDECHLLNECHMSPLEEEFREGSLQSALSWESHTSMEDSAFTTESDSVPPVAATAAAATTAAAAATMAIGNSSLEEITGFENSLKQHASQKPSLSTPVSYMLSFEDATAVPNVPLKTCQNHYRAKEPQEERNYEAKEKKKSTKGRSTSQTMDHIVAERKRRENLTRKFIALSATIPGLKKMDKASVLNGAIDYVKQLQKRVKELGEQNKKRRIESVEDFDNSNVCVGNDFSCKGDGWDGPTKAFPNIEASVSEKDVLIRVLCQKQKDIVPKMLAKLETNNLTIACSSVLPFGNSALHMAIIARMDSEFSMTMDDLVKILNQDLLKCCEIQH